MKLNKKGFTLIEILATVTILGILSGVAVIATSRYLDKARNDSYKAMEESSYVAAQNYLQKHNPVIPVFTERRKNNTVTFDETTSDANLKKVMDGTSCKTGGCVYKLESSTLVEEGFLDEFEDPKSKGTNCGANIYITKTKASGQTLESYTYLVEITGCTGYTSSHKILDKNGVETDKEAIGKFFRS